MAEKEKKSVTIVIKKIEVSGGGAHGGSWKVAFADFMTAMMAFFLVMWLLNQSEETKKAVARYFSGPSVIEQQLSAYGAELTLEKLFLDLVNEPLRPLQTFLQPADRTPNIMSLGMKKLVLMHLAAEMGSIAKNVEVTEDELRFDIPDYYLFEKGSEKPSGQFLTIMEKMKTLTTGLEDSTVDINSQLNPLVHGDNIELTERVANHRLEIIKTQITNSFESDSAEVKGKISLPKGPVHDGKTFGMIQIRIKQKDLLPDGKKPRPLRGEIGKRSSDLSIYDDFVNRMSKTNRKEK